MPDELDIEKNLILIKDKDQTKNIALCVLKGEKYLIRFKQGKEYSYNKTNIIWLRNPKCFSGDSTVVYKNTIPLSQNDDTIFDFGTYIKIISANGYQNLYSSKDLNITFTFLNNKKANNTLEYLKKIALYTSISNEDEESFLSKQYKKLSFISKESVLARYLDNTKSCRKKSISYTPIYPFGFNISQMQSTEKALTTTISIIEGPPGTGKTRVRVEHIFAFMTNAMNNGLSMKYIGKKRIASSIGLLNLTYNLFRYEQLLRLKIVTSI